MVSIGRRDRRRSCPGGQIMSVMPDFAGRAAIALVVAIAAMTGMLYLVRAPEPPAQLPAAAAREKPRPADAEKRLLERAVRDERQRQGEESLEGRARTLAPFQAK
jgi:hypothetical protein